jgi:hypothetical protein
MSWRRGFFRLWIVGSLLWFALAAVSTGFGAAVVGALSPSRPDRSVLLDAAH